jgi:catechol 2,3-dioxygenase-like lactoylglutathione lyase family enzyme
MTNDSVNVRFGMLVIYARDLQRSIEFYRLLGLAVPDPQPDRPVSLYRLANGVTLIFTTDMVAARFDPGWARPGAGYQQVTEFLVDDDAAVDAVWARLTAAGHHGRTAPGHLIGPYATMVDDPDGNVVLISHDPVTSAVAAGAA